MILSQCVSDLWCVFKSVNLNLKQLPITEPVQVQLMPLPWQPVRLKCCRSGRFDGTVHHDGVTDDVVDVFSPAVSRGPIVQFKLSDIGEGIMEVTVKEWYVLTHQ